MNEKWLEQNGLFGSDFCSSLGFSWFRIIRSMYLPAALHGIESSLLAAGSLRNLRSSICKVVWPRKGPTLANPNLANLWPSWFWPRPIRAKSNFAQIQFGPIQFRPNHFWQIHFWIWCVSWPQRVGPNPERIGPRSVGP